MHNIAYGGGARRIVIGEKVLPVRKRIMWLNRTAAYYRNVRNKKKNITNNYLP